MSEHEHSQTKSTKLPTKKIVFASIVILLIAAVGFYVGTRYQKSRDVADAEAQKNAAQIAATPIIGKVTEISDKKIAIKLTKSGKSNSYNITSSTTVTNNGKKANASDIQKDQSVIILTTPGKPNDARRISISTLPTSLSVPQKTN